MAEWNKILLGKQAKELGFVRDTYEKICRLTEVLKFFETDELLGSFLALKGGTEFKLDNIEKITQNRIKTNLYPVLRSKDKFDLKSSQLQVMTWIESLLRLDDNEWKFLEEFRDKKYRPDLIFESKEILERIINHPMALWKCSNK